MRYFFDTEFIEDGHTIDLISIGIVCEDGREFYGISADADYRKAWENPWVREHVLTQLPKQKAADWNDRDLGWSALDWSHPAVNDRKGLRDDILEFVGEMNPQQHFAAPEFWAYYADYDWIVMCQLFGKMIDLPKGWPMYCRDLKQLADMLGNPALPAQAGGEHNALEDARWNVQAFEFLSSVAAGTSVWRL